MELFQIGKQIKLQCHIAGTDADFSQFHILHLVNLLHTHFDLFVPFCHIGIQQFSLTGQPYSLGRPVEQSGIQGIFQLLDGLTDRRL